MLMPYIRNYYFVFCFWLFYFFLISHSVTCYQEQQVLNQIDRNTFSVCTLAASNCIVVSGWSLRLLFFPARYGARCYTWKKRRVEKSSLSKEEYQSVIHAFGMLSSVGGASQRRISRLSPIIETLCIMMSIRNPSYMVQVYSYKF